MSTAFYKRPHSKCLQFHRLYSFPCSLPSTVVKQQPRTTHEWKSVALLLCSSVTVSKLIWQWARPSMWAALLSDQTPFYNGFFWSVLFQLKEIWSFSWQVCGRSAWSISWRIALLCFSAYLSQSYLFVYWFRTQMHIFFYYKVDPRSWSRMSRRHSIVYFEPR